MEEGSAGERTGSFSQSGSEPNDAYIEREIADEETEVVFFRFNIMILTLIDSIGVLEY